MSRSFWRDPTIALLSVWVAGCFVLSALDGSLSTRLIEVWVANVLPYFILSLAAGMVISCGQIDISTGGIMSLAGMIIIACFQIFGGAVSSAVFAHVLATVLVIFIYFAYSAIASRGISTLLATLSLLLVAKGGSTLIQSCLQGVGEVCRAASFITSGSAILPTGIVVDWVGDPIFAAVAYTFLLVAFVYWRFLSRWGLEHIAVGMDVEAARFCRISIRSIYTRAFLTAGVLVILATLVRLHGSSQGGWSANVGWGDELLAIAIAVIGGTRISGGKINPIGILLASFGVYISRDIIINDLGVPAEVASLLFGALLLFVVVADVSRPKFVKGQRG